MRLLHLSDLHGRAFRRASRLVERLRPDWVVLTGDLLPDYPLLDLLRPGRAASAQARFWARQSSLLLPEGLPVTYVRGNHEAEGFEVPDSARAVPPGWEGRVGLLEGIPSINGVWGFPREMPNAELQAELDAQGHPWILLAHVPPLGILDRVHDGVRVGSAPLAARLRAKGAPGLVLCGHVHESFGAEWVGGALVVNAAGGWAHLQLDPDQGRVELLDMGLLVRTGPLRRCLRVLHPLASFGTSRPS